MSFNYVNYTLLLGDHSRSFIMRGHTSDEAVFKQIFEMNEYNIAKLRRAAEIINLYKEIISSGKTPLIVDAGANIGAAAVFFSMHFPLARIVAIEPDKENFLLLARNTEGLNVQCIHAAVASSPGRVRLIDPGAGYWGFRTERVAAGDADMVSLDCVTLNEIYESNENFSPFIVKIDIEGAEAELFSANTEWFARTPLAMVELHDWLYTSVALSRNFLGCAAALGRDCVFIGENVFTIRNPI